MKKFENLGRMLSREEQKKILGGDPPGGCSGSGGGNPICEGECPDVGGTRGCPQGQKCYNVSCPEDETICTNRCY